MTTDLTIALAQRPGTLADACEALGRVGVNIEGAFGTVFDGHPQLHVLVAEASHATRALIDAGFEILAERQVIAKAVENRPGAGAALLRRITEAGVNVDLMYTTLDGRVVLGSDDLGTLREAIGE
jgi:hypothetical protein